MSGVGSGLSSIFQGIGGFMAAGGYGEAARLDEENAKIARLSGDIQLTQADREAYRVVGATEANVAANGFSLSGSALDILKSNTQQLALNKNLVANQAMIDVNSWKEKAAAERGAADAATVGGIGDIVGGIVGIFSDVRLKNVIDVVDELEPGINRYRFRYRGDKTVWIGVLAQEVLAVHPELVSLDKTGYLKVNYAGLGLEGMIRG